VLVDADGVAVNESEQLGDTVGVKEFVYIDCAPHQLPVVIQSSPGGAVTLRGQARPD
jgi:hypothetical protein